MATSASAGPIGIIILAAGESSRMGSPKQLLQYKEETLLEKVVQLAGSLDAGPVVVVLGANAGPIQEKVSLQALTCAINEKWATGMGSSVAAGIRALEARHPEVKAALFLLVDQPLIEKKHLVRLIEKHEAGTAPLTVAAYNDTFGVPALFDRSLFSELLELDGEKGAKPIIKKYRGVLNAVSLPAARLDVDTPEDWADFLERK